MEEQEQPRRNPGRPRGAKSGPSKHKVKQQELFPETQMHKSVDDDGFPGYDDANFEYGEEVSSENIVTVMRVPNPMERGKPHYVFCDDYFGQMPTRPEIGKRFGGGVFHILIKDSLGRRTGNARRICLDVETWKHEHEKYLKEQFPGSSHSVLPATLSIPERQVPAVDPMAMFEKILGAVEKMMATKSTALQNASPVQAADPFKAMEKMSAFMSNMVEKNSERLIEMEDRMIEKYGNRGLSPVGIVEDEDDSDVSKIMKMIEMAKPFLGLLAGMTPEARHQQTEALLQDDTVRRVIASRDKTIQAISRMESAGMSEEQIGLVMDSFGIEIGSSSETTSPPSPVS